MVLGPGILNSFEWNKAERHRDGVREKRGAFGEIESGNAYSFEGAGDLNECVFLFSFFSTFSDFVYLILENIILYYIILFSRLSWLESFNGV
jgi:hypothetical protein